MESLYVVAQRRSYTTEHVLHKEVIAPKPFCGKLKLVYLFILNACFCLQNFLVMLLLELLHITPSI